MSLKFARVRNLFKL